MRARKNITWYIGVLIVGLLMSGCKPDEPSRQLAMPISICVPAGEVYATQAPAQRAFGDPGTTEQFALPKYIYIYIVKYIEGDGGKANNANWKVWDIITKEPTASEWEMSHYVGSYETGGDSILRYKTEVNLMLESGCFDGRIYIYASAVSLTLSTTISTESTLADLLNLSFSFDGTEKGNDKVVNNLQNIYSTPYNYTAGGTDYYGSFYATQNVPHFDLLLYHVAAKVDVMWNVAEDKRNVMKLSYLAAEHLYDGPCLLFRPMENELGIEKYTSGYTKELATNNIGTQWNGRAYFYTIPYKNNAATKVFPLQLCMLKNGDSPEIPAVPPSEDPTVRPNAEYYHMIQTTPMSTDAIFMPWVRCQININKELEYSATVQQFN